MRLRTTAALLAIVASFCACTGCAPIAELQPEQPARVRIGDLAAVRVDSDHHYAVGSAGNSIRLIKRAEERGTTVYVHRAVAPGQHTLVLTPRDPGPDGCISCVTVHYFITVVE
jgi:hypothetical protein